MANTFKILKHLASTYRKTDIETLNYQQLGNDLLELSQADYVLINIALKPQNKIRTVSISVRKHDTEVNKKRSFFNLENQEWDPEDFTNLTEHCLVHKKEATSNGNYTASIHNVFENAVIYSIALLNGTFLVGSFTFITSTNFKQETLEAIDLFSQVISDAFYLKKLLLASEKALPNVSPISEPEVTFPLKDRINDILKSVDDVMWYTDLMTGEHYYGNNAHHIFGYTAEEFSNDKDLWWKIIHPEDLEQTIYKYDVLSSMNNGKAEFEYRASRKDGVEINIYARIKIEKNEANQFVKILGLFSDITTLRNTERRLNHAQSISKMGSWEFDLRTQDFSWSKQHYELFELTAVSRDNLYDAYRSKILPDDLFKMNELIDSTIRLGTNYEFEFRIFCNDGSEKYILSLGECVKNEKDEVIGLRGTSQDITDRKKIEEKLAHQSKQILEITGAVNQSAMVTRSDANGTIVFANGLFCKTSGYSTNELIGKNNRVLGSGYHSQAFWENFWNTITSGAIWKGEIKNRTNTGKDYWVYTVINPILDEKGCIEEYLAIMFDVTERKNTELELSNVKQQIDDIINNVDAAMWSTDMQGNYLFINKATEVLSGYHANEFTSEKKFWRRLFSDATLEKIKTNYADLNKEGNIEKEYELITRSGEKKWVLIKSNLMKDAAGNSIRIDSISTDITKKIVYEQEIKTAREKAEFANTAKTEFMANISHEIRTPMNAILGFADLLKGKTISAKHEDYLKGILAGGKSLLLLIDDILDLSKIEAGKMEIQQSVVCIEAMVKEVYTIFKHRAKEKNLTLKYAIGLSTPKYLLLDEVRLRQILFNLTGNAIKFTDSGEVSIRISSSYPTSEPKIKLTIDISDTGIGIPEDQREIIFEPFRQMDGQSTRKYGGTGLGLAITKRLVNMMDGRISIKSEPGKGTTLSVVLNDVLIAIDEVSDSHMEEETECPDFCGQTILLVEDVESNREIMKGFLEPYNVNIIEAENGEIALNILKNLTPDLILMDMMMPVVDGYIATRHIKSQKKLQHIPIIAVTAAGLSHNESDIRRLCDDYIRKPLNKETLLRVLKNYLSYIPGTLQEEVPFQKHIVQESSAEILVIEDNELSQNYIHSVLEEAGYDTITAGTGSEAIIQMQKYHPGLVLLDISLPDMNGEELYHKLLDVNPDASIIVVSGYTKKEILKKHPGLTVNNYLLKPVSIHELLELVEKNMEIPYSYTSQEEEPTTYDYSVAVKSSMGSAEQFKKWVIEFIDLLEASEQNLTSYSKAPTVKLDHKLLHDLLNYTVQFGATDLKILIWKLKELENNATPELKIVVKAIINEIGLLKKFYNTIE